MVLDTNILIYSTKPGGEYLRPWLDDSDAIGWHWLTPGARMTA